MKEGGESYARERDEAQRRDETRRLATRKRWKRLDVQFSDLGELSVRRRPRASEDSIARGRCDCAARPDTLGPAPLHPPLPRKLLLLLGRRAPPRPRRRPELVLARRARARSRADLVAMRVRRVRPASAVVGVVMMELVVQRRLFGHCVARLGRVGRRRRRGEGREAPVADGRGDCAWGRGTKGRAGYAGRGAGGGGVGWRGGARGGWERERDGAVVDRGVRRGEQGRRRGDLRRWTAWARRGR